MKNSFGLESREPKDDYFSRLKTLKYLVRSLLMTVLFNSVALISLFVLAFLKHSFFNGWEVLFISSNLGFIFSIIIWIMIPEIKDSSTHERQATNEPFNTY